MSLTTVQEEVESWPTEEQDRLAAHLSMLRRQRQSSERPRLTGVGRFRSGRSDVSERAEEILGDAAKDRR